jgi:hypothetical protein
MKDNKKFNHNALAWIIIVLLSLILVVLVFKIGMMIGSSKSHFSSCNYKKAYSGHWSKKLDYMKKSEYLDYRGVAKLTETGFVTVDAKGNEQEVVVNEDTKIFKGEVSDGVKVSMDDKVYVDGTLDENGQLIAEIIKIYDKGGYEFIK